MDLILPLAVLGGILGASIGAAANSNRKRRDKIGVLFRDHPYITGDENIASVLSQLNQFAVANKELFWNICGTVELFCGLYYLPTDAQAHVMRRFRALKYRTLIQNDLMELFSNVQQYNAKAAARNNRRPTPVTVGHNRPGNGVQFRDMILNGSFMSPKPDTNVILSEGDFKRHADELYKTIENYTHNMLT